MYYFPLNRLISLIKNKLVLMSLPYGFQEFY